MSGIFGLAMSRVSLRLLVPETWLSASYQIQVQKLGPCNTLQGYPQRVSVPVRDARDEPLSFELVLPNFPQLDIHDYGTILQVKVNVLS